ncbi:MAG: cytochrome c [Massilia sp.]|nr:cytochrome c [Massilia sp.]
MRRLTIAVAQLALLGSALCATFDVDGDLMRGIDDTAKSLDSNVAQKDAKAAAADARSLVDTFAHVESHYAEKPQTADAVGFAHHTQELAAQALKAIEASDFDAAGDAVARLTRSCKNCHEVYKKD